MATETISKNPNDKKSLMIISGLFQKNGGIAAVNRLVLKTLSDVSSSIKIYSLLEKTSKIDNAYSGSSIISLHVFHGNKIRFALSILYDLFKSNYDYIYVDHVNIASLLFPVVIIKKIKYITWIHGIEVFDPLPDFEGKIGLRFAWKRLCSSQYTSDVVNLRFPDFKTIPCDLALDPILYSHESLRYDQNCHGSLEFLSINGVSNIIGKKLILNVGRMVSGERFKGQLSLLKAFPKVKVKHPDAQLLLAGTGNEYESYLNIARRLPLEIQECIFMPGFVPDQILRELYQSCYVFAMPSIGEGFGLAYLEAMAYKKPTLGGKVDATPFVIRDGISGLLVENPRSSEQVADALIWFLDHPRETQQMGIRGFELVHSYYLFPKFAQRFWDAIENNKRE